MRITFQHMFPTINTKTVKLSDCRRVVLYHYHKEEGTVEMRHYAIKAQPTGVSSAVKRILQSRIPNLGELEVRSKFVCNVLEITNLTNFRDSFLKKYLAILHDI